MERSKKLNSNEIKMFTLNNAVVLKGVLLRVFSSRMENFRPKTQTLHLYIAGSKKRVGFSRSPFSRPFAAEVVIAGNEYVY